MLDNQQMIDAIIVKLGSVADNHGVMRCGLIWEIFKMLQSLKTGLENEKKEHEKEIAELREILDAYGNAEIKVEEGVNE